MNKKNTKKNANVKKNADKARAKKPAYTRLTVEDVADVVTLASRYVGGYAYESLADFEVEPCEEAAGTWFLNVWVGAKIEAEVIEAALRESCAAAGHNFDVSAKYGDFDMEESGRHEGKRMVYFYIAAGDFPMFKA